MVRGSARVTSVCNPKRWKRRNRMRINLPKHFEMHRKNVFFCSIVNVIDYFRLDKRARERRQRSAGHQTRGVLPRDMLLFKLVATQLLDRDASEMLGRRVGDSDLFGRRKAEEIFRSFVGQADFAGVTKRNGEVARSHRSCDGSRRGVGH